MSLLSPGFDTGTYVITRTTKKGVQDANGHYASAAPITLPVTGSLQPLSERALRDLKEGVRADDVRWFFTDTPMFTVDQGHEVQDFLDAIDDNGITERYRVMKVAHYTVLSGHFRVTVEKVSVP
jgi:hypothetical protein